MITGRFITEKQDKLIQELIDEHRRKSQNLLNRSSTEITWDEGVAHQAPEVYIARPIEGFIPALQRGIGGSGGSLDQPGSAECNIYQITKDMNGNPELTEASSPKWVYNLSTSSMSDWILAIRDKWGRWLGVLPGNATTMFRARLHGEKKSYYMDTVPPFGNRYRGEYSWCELMEILNNGLPFWITKPGGRFGVAGQCDAAREENNFNGNLQVENTIVQMYEGLTISCPSSEMSDASWCPDESDESHVSGDMIGESQILLPADNLVSTNYRYWFNFGVPRDDGPKSKRHIISHVEGNDTP